MVYAPLFILGWAWVGWLFRPLDRYIPLRIPDGFAAPGAVIGAAGIALSLTNMAQLVIQGLGTPAIFDPPTKFVPSGPYQFVRNPMYLGYVIMLVGWALYLGSPALLLYAVGVFLLIHAFVVLAEEPGLKKRFGQEYEAYCRAVSRWVPVLRH